MRTGDIKVTNVYRTNNLGQFKIMIDNREVKEQRIKKLMDSIARNGWLHAPIMVNERNEVIDGQGRLEACKRLKRDIEYIVVPGFGINECRELNKNTRNWTTLDYIDSYAAGGNANYIRLKNLLKIYPKINAVMFAAGLYGATNVGNGEKLKSGRVVLTDEIYDEAARCLAWLATLKPTMEAIENSRKSLERGLIAAYVNPAADNDRMAEQLQRYCRQVAEVSTIDGALKELSRIYNIRIRGPKVYLDTDYAKLKEGMEALK